MNDLPLSPVVRRLISQSGIDPASISGTGIGGPITPLGAYEIAEWSKVIDVNPLD